MSDHSRFGGSVAPRYMNCTGSVALVETVDNPTTSFAEEGTRAHAFVAHLLREGERDASLYAGLPVAIETEVIDVDQEMADAAQVYIDAVYAEVDTDPECELFVEKRFAIATPSADEGEVFGTNDALVYQPATKKLTVFDFKYGKGMSVSAEENAQLKFYAAGAALSHLDWPLETVELVIVQPRARDIEHNGAVRRWPFDVVALLDFAGELDAKIKEAKDAPTLNVGPWCDKTFCPARAICPAQEEAALKLIGQHYASVSTVRAETLPAVSGLARKRLPEIREGIRILVEWGAAIDEFLFNELNAGREVKGFKLVEKVSRRKWADNEQEIGAYLGMMFDIPEDHLRPRKLVTITEADRLMKAAGASKDDRDEVALRYMIKESSGLVMAPESDRRPAVNPVEADFSSVDMTAVME